MRWTDYLRLGWDQLRRRLVVTLLCVIGIAIGSSSIIVALAFGESVTQFSEQRIGFYLKTDEIQIYPGQDSSDSAENKDSRSTSGAYDISKQKIEIIRSLPNVISIAPFNRLQYFNFTADSTKKGSAELIATDLTAMKDFGFELQQGAYQDLNNAIILSYGATVNLYDERTAAIRRTQSQRISSSREEEPLIPYPLYQKTILLEFADVQTDGTLQTVSFPVRVIGILKRPEGMPDSMVRYDRTAYISLELGERIQEAMQKSRSAYRFVEKSIKAKVDSVEHVRQTEEWIRKLKLNTQSNLQQQESMQQEFVIVRLVFGGIGLFILFVASISIIVAMTMSTYQRRRQIGIMKVLGSNLRQIRNMFIVESTLLGLLGGIAGIVLSYWVIWLINIVVQKFSEGSSSEELLFISFWILPVGLFFAVLTGVLSGIFPAIKASRTDALTAIKRE
ncbi:ABC transporter permease [Paenibacillus sp. 32O-W]|uniref:ABC transporter permease n=1 Tax=Paenibacillus sp. 32O-W TaxID=1695218 RepID=UPI0011A0E4DF|nr:ABC transporter permease [Paenibacillus sp. 32O-W]